MGKKRKTTAKTGDKKLYKGRELTVSTKKKGDDDNMYDEVDRYHNQQDEEYIHLDSQPNEHIDDDGYEDKEAVLDLAGGVSSSEEEDSDVGDSADDSEQDADGGEEDSEHSSDDDEEDEEIDDEAVTDWGRRKSAYFGGDTADLEIGQDEEDAYLEEEAAKEVQNARYETMEDDDFVLSDNEIESEKPSHKGIETLKKPRDLKKLSNAAKRKFLQSHHPELIPLVSHFSDVVSDWHERTRVVADVLLCTKDVSPEDVGATTNGLEYILTKSMLQASCALNVASYLLLKSEQTQKEKNADDLLVEVDAGSAIKSHPVIARLQQLDKLSMKLEDTVESKIPNIADQIDSLVKAALLMKDGDDADDDSDDNDEDEDDDESSENSDHVSESKDDVETHVESSLHAPVPNDESNQQDIAQAVLNEARFGLRPKEISSKAVRKQGRRPASWDFGDEEEDESKSRKVAQSLASTINAIEQRSSTNARKAGQRVEDLDTQGGDDDDRVNKGIAMMEAELGPFDEDMDEGYGEEQDEMDDELNDFGSNSFYDQIKKKSQVHKAFKKQQYAVAPKFPVMEGVVEGERAISKVILKNRGLVAHKAKINRNPRVKKREQYRKALISRRGAVREVRTGEVDKYGGEATGIKAGVSRSRKLGTR